ncbi:hypothetical protein ONS95_014118 [Cadophora gregata]|uniref:uncharacterized protein n=1 Tax=Cadophora gregata TaxID=51156 RepID=UPI0026DB72C9|nr:uncharacterized protein ONS95_014118 [Cadophora gregata]KAK0113873.1 hypothetical protein ONS96_014723 [Cadophora gregata f. sp. sojae]KAK0114632.1 hypothetical protein ONS95_014118 [Cadophora gregata]
MSVIVILRCVTSFSLFAALAVATTGQIPLTAKPTFEASTPPNTAPSTLPTISYSTTIKLPDLNLNINAAQLEDPELENIISSLLPAEMLTLLVSATARSVSQSPAEAPTVGQIIPATSTELPVTVSTSVSIRGGDWKGVVEATTTVSIAEGKADL